VNHSRLYDPPQQFLESFFQEKIAIYIDANVRLAPVLAKYFGEPLSDRLHDFLLLDRMKEVFEVVKESADSAIIITTVKSDRWAGAGLRKRYHLAAVGGEWKITRIDSLVCVYCGGTGQSEQAPCQHCGGEGWVDTSKGKAQQRKECS
jgi:hypothetical protein